MPHQFKVTNSDDEVRHCGDLSSLNTMTMASNGDVLYTVAADTGGSETFTIGRLTLYYIDTSDPIDLVIEGTNPSITSFRRTIAAGSSTPTTGGITWQLRDGNLVVRLAGPDVTSEANWVFGALAPPLNLKVKVKRQGASNSGACSGSGWT